jgi:hypothetical protein
MGMRDIAREAAVPPRNSTIEAGRPAVSVGRGNDCAEASRFQRFYIALLCILAVLLDDPRFIYPVTVSVVVILLSSTRYEPSVLFYRHVVFRVIGQHPWPIAPDAGGKYLLGHGTEKFVFAVMGFLLALAIYLSETRFDLWVVPVAAMAAGVSLAATTGICLMGIVYMKLFNPDIS